MKIKGAIFDMDGTIVDSLSFWDCLWRSIGEKYMGNPDFKPDDEVNKKVRTMIYVDAMTYFKEYYQLAVSTEEFVEFASDGVIDFYENTATVKEGAVALLGYLKENGIKLCLASATAMPWVMHTLKYHGLLQYFDFVLSCADIGVGKEHPDIYIKASELLCLPAGEICVFEDSYVAMETAKAAGFRTAGVYDKYAPGQERLVAASDVYLNPGKSLADLIDSIEI